MNLLYQPRLTEGITYLDGDEAHHAIKVLRLTKGEPISITDGKGLSIQATVSSSEKNLCHFNVTSSITSPGKKYSIHLLVAPTKNSDRMEWLVEKATEIGVDSITMVQCERSERKKISHERLLKMAVSAMKQSQQPWLPDVRTLTSFKDAIGEKYDQKFIAFVDHTNPDHLKNLAKPGKTYGLLIGPEGDFTSSEMELARAGGWNKVSLGNTRLRTETAGLVGCLTLVLSNP